jgi:hypothetical protein
LIRRLSRHRRPTVLVGALLALLVIAAPSYATLAAPKPSSPGSGVTVDNAPTFVWSAVSGADHYDVQVSGTSGFTSIVTSGSTKNTRFAVTTALQSGTYYWRVRAGGASSNGLWSPGRPFTVDWADAATAVSPLDGDSIVYPDPLLLRWTPVPGAQKYQVSIASDPDLSSLVAGYPQADGSTTTAATAYSPADRLASGTYYWAVTPVDAEGHLGTESQVYHFNWSWPDSTTLSLTDLDPNPQVFDPKFSWTPVEGAAKYEVEVNSDQNWASGSRVCCSSLTIATSMTPTVLLPADTYYWRVRPYDANNNPGDWSYYTDSQASPADTFTINYDPGTSSISNLSMRDENDDPIAWSAGGVSTQVPIVSWDPVPGAASYEVDVTPWNDASLPNACDYTAPVSVQWDVSTASTSWTPLGDNWNLGKPFSNSHNVAQDGSTALVAGSQYCVRVRAARSNSTKGDLVYGDWTYIGPNNGSDAAFTFTGYPTGSACTPSCNANYLGSGDYILPAADSDNVRMPLFTWNPISGKQSYFVIVATDPNFQHVVDYAFTKIPAYAPRAGLGQWTTYADTSSKYYWAVLPATQANGGGAVGDPVNSAAAQDFQKQSVAPTLISPAGQAIVPTQPDFQWSPVEGAYYYHLEVSTAAQFTCDQQTPGPTCLENVGKSSVNALAESSYSSNTTYPAGQTLYWRVQAVDRAGTGLAWSDTGQFTKTLPAPTFSGITAPFNPTTSDSIPVWKWNPVPGAISYDVQLTCPLTMSCTNGSNLDTTATSLLSLTGELPFTWKVRANFPTGSGQIHGAWSDPQNFQRAIAAPTGEVNQGNGTLHNFSFAWAPKAGAKQYIVQVSTSRLTNSDGSFQSTVQTITTDNAIAAPTLESPTTAYTDGGTLYWHVAAKDADGNVGTYSAPLSFKLPLKIAVASDTSVMVRKTTKTVTITTKDARNHVISGVTVKVSGAGVTATSKKTGTGGKVTFKVHPTKGGKITFKATKSGCTSGSTTINVL